jgi:hypothetical protein
MPEQTGRSGQILPSHGSVFIQCSRYGQTDIIAAIRHFVDYASAACITRRTFGASQGRRSGAMPSADRGNMCCLEALGSGSLLLTDEGNYREGIGNGRTMVTYDSPEDAVRPIKILLNNP